MSASAEPMVRDAARLQREEQAAREALAGQVIKKFEAQNPSKEIVAFVRHLGGTLHGADVYVRGSVPRRRYR